MKINTKKYRLESGNFYSDPYQKKQIVLGNTFSSDMSHTIGWKTRVGGKFKRGSHFSVDTNGDVHQHFDIESHSDFLPNNLYSKHIISISLVNPGWIELDAKDMSYFNVNGSTYMGGSDNFIEKRWRSYSMWVKYTENQVNSTIKLIDKLCNEIKIPKNVISHNTQIKQLDVMEFGGVLYRSNWIKDATDLSPTWEFNKFKSIIEGNIT